METADILIVDDDVNLRWALFQLLNKSYAVVDASNGKQALRVLKTQRPRLVLLDITMPKMSGIEVLRAARELDKTLRIVMLTSRHEIELATIALDLGAIEFITKPFDAGFIRREVARLLAPPPEGADRSTPWRVVE